MKTIGMSEEKRLERVARKGKMKDISEGEEDVQYWLSRPAKERIAAVTFLISQFLEKDERMDKSVIRKRRAKRK